jgi:hypothetical protein
MLAFSDMFNLLANEFTGLRGRSLTFPRLLMSAFQRFLFRHRSLLLI